MSNEQESKASELQTGTTESKIQSKTVIVTLIAVNVLTLTGLIVMMFLRPSAPAPAQAKENLQGTAQEGSEESGEGEEGGKKVFKKLGQIVDLGSFVVNLNEPGSPRYLRVTIKVELDHAETSDEIKNRDPQLRHEVILYLSSLMVKQTQGVKAKEEIRENIQRRINNLLQVGKVVRTYITEFVIQ